MINSTLVKMPEHYAKDHMVEVEDLPKVGWITITWIGEENLYFRDVDGNCFYCKCL